MNAWKSTVVSASLLLGGCVAPGGAPAADTDRIEVQGMFRYLADAPTLRDCRTGRVFPVAMAGPYIELERAYLNSGIEPAGELPVLLLGRFLERPAMEGNLSEINFVVDEFKNILDSVDCAPAIPRNLLETHWRLRELHGQEVAQAEGMPDIHMVLEQGSSSVSGFSGCNRFFGQYRVNGDALDFSALGSTMMACPEGMETEQAFLQALGATDRAVLSGLTLELYSADDRLARFEGLGAE